jgi:hypothetical protein
VIAKLPTADDEVRTMAQLLGFYEREVRFYQELAHRVPLRTPHAYFADMAAASGRYVLILEDLAPGRCGDQIASCTIDEAQMVLTQLAGLHATWWNQSGAQEVSWLPAISDQIIIQVLQALFQQSWPSFAETFGGRLPRELLDVGERFGANFSHLAEVAAGRPLTVVHTDFRLDNMFFDLADGSPLAVVDWQLLQRGPGLIDVTYFLAGNFPPEVRRTHERRLLAAYHDELVRRGVRDYSFDDALEDYRRASLFLLVFIVTNRENVDIASYGERAQALFDTILDRYTTAILDLKAAEFLPA